MPHLHLKEENEAELLRICSILKSLFGQREPRKFNLKFLLVDSRLVMLLVLIQMYEDHVVHLLYYRQNRLIHQDFYQQQSFFHRFPFDYGRMLFTNYHSICCLIYV